jgi:hypothetical protein
VSDSSLEQISWVPEFITVLHQWWVIKVLNLKWPGSRPYILILPLELHFEKKTKEKKKKNDIHDAFTDMVTGIGG